MSLQCAVCHREIAISEEGTTDRCARIERGDFRLDSDLGGDADRNDDNIKYETFVCQPCFLNDPDLCRFFNKIGDRIR